MQLYAIPLPRPATPSAPEPGEVAGLVGWLNQVAQYLVDNGVTGAPYVRGAAILLERQEAELATLKDDGWAKAMTNLVDQIGGDGPSLWEWGASIPTPQKVVEYLREHIDYLEYLGRVQGALTALKVDPVEKSERPWEREGWCNEKGDFWAEGINREGIAEWKQVNRNYLGSWMVRCLPHNAIPLPPPQTGEAAELMPVAENKLDDAFMGGVCASLALVTAHGDATIWREIVRSVGIDSLLNYAANVNPEDWDLAGFSKYAQAELGKGKPLPAPQAGEVEA